MRPTVLLGSSALALVLSTACATGLEPGRDTARDPARAEEAGCPDPGPEPPSDGIVSVDATHGATDVVVEVGLRQIEVDIEQNLDVVLVTPDGAWSYGVGRAVRRDGTERVHRRFSAEESELPDGAAPCGVYMTAPEGLPCRGGRAAFDLGAEVVTIVVPRPCLENPAWVQVGVRAYFIEGHDLVMSDVWGDRSDDGDALPPLGEPTDAPAGAPIGCQERAPETRDAPGPGPGQLAWMGDPPCLR